MIRTKILISCFIATFIYVVLSLIAGKNGLFVYKNMEEQKIEIAKRTNEIEKINNDLSLECTALKKDKDIVASYARKLGYVKEDEKIVKIKGLKPYQLHIYDIGSVLHHSETKYLSETYCKMLGLLSFFISAGIFMVLDYLHGNLDFKKKKPLLIQGIPVYDIKQI